VLSPGASGHPSQTLPETLFERLPSHSKKTPTNPPEYAFWSLTLHPPVALVEVKEDAKLTTGGAVLLGWSLNLLVGELWIRRMASRTRPRSFLGVVSW